MTGLVPRPARRRFEQHEGLAALTALTPEWTALFARAYDPTPFQHPAWLLACARHVPGGEPIAWLMRDPKGPLAALLPLVRRDDGSLELLGGPVTDYRDLLLERAADPETIAQLLTSGLAAAGVTRLQCHDLRPQSPLLHVGPPAGWTLMRAPGEVCPTVTLPDGPSARLREDLPRFTRRLGRAGALTFRRDDDSESGELMGWLCRLHAERWQLRGEPGVLAAPPVQALHLQAARDLGRAGHLVLRALCLDGEVLAVLYGFRDRQRFYYYASGFRPAFASFSPGSVLIGDTRDAAVAAGARELHFLRGAEPYKYRWGARDRFTWRLTLERRT